MNWFFNSKVSLSARVLLFLMAVSLFFTFFFVHWGSAHHPFVYDVNQYYSYLNALFIDHDLCFTNNPNGYWLIETATHNYVPKVTYGVSFFYMPFYLLAWLFSPAGSTGYEPLYAWFVHFGCILYILLGLLFVRNTLLVWFNEMTTAISLLLLFFGTNLFYYTMSESESVHGILFFLLALFFHQSVKWYYHKSHKAFLCFMLAAGFICLIRPTEVIVLLVPAFAGVLGFRDLKDRVGIFVNMKWYGIAGVFIFLVPIVPQLCFWKVQSGDWFFFSYGQAERFYFSDPEFANVLWSYRKGWLVYTPLMVLSLIGFFFMYIKNRTYFFPLLIYFLINLYLISSWWDWAYGGSFGMRAFVHSYAFLIIPFAYAIEAIIAQKKIKIAAGILIAFLCFLNVFQSNLYKHGIISYDGMTKEAYWFTFLRKNYSKEDLQYLETLVKHPDYAGMRAGKRND